MSKTKNVEQKLEKEINIENIKNREVDIKDIMYVGFIPVPVTCFAMKQLTTMFDSQTRPRTTIILLFRSRLRLDSSLSSNVDEKKTKNYFELSICTL